MADKKELETKVVELEKQLAAAKDRKVKAARDDDDEAFAAATIAAKRLQSEISALRAEIKTQKSASAKADDADECKTGTVGSKRRSPRTPPPNRLAYTRHATAGDQDDRIIAPSLNLFYKIMAWGGGVAILWIFVSTAHCVGANSTPTASVRPVAPVQMAPSSAPVQPPVVIQPMVVQPVVIQPPTAPPPTVKVEIQNPPPAVNPPVPKEPERPVSRIWDSPRNR